MLNENRACFHTPMPSIIYAYSIITTLWLNPEPKLFEYIEGHK